MKISRSEPFTAQDELDVVHDMAEANQRLARAKRIERLAWAHLKLGHCRRCITFTDAMHHTWNLR